MYELPTLEMPTRRQLIVDMYGTDKQQTVRTQQRQTVRANQFCADYFTSRQVPTRNSPPIITDVEGLEQEVLCDTE